MWRISKIPALQEFTFFRERKIIKKTNKETKLGRGLGLLEIRAAVLDAVVRAGLVRA